MSIRKITSRSIGLDVIAAEDLAANSVTAAEITNGAVTPAKLQTGTDFTINSLTVGRGAGAVSTNTAVGASALAANTSGISNTGVGSNSLGANTTGGSNGALGYLSLFANTTGTNNSAIGRSALEQNTTGGTNTAIGAQALRFNTTASGNTAVGYSAARNNTTGINDAYGYQALYYNTTGTNNAAMGYGSLQSNTTGGYNTGLGYFALYSNTTGSENTTAGYRAGYSLTTGNGNTFIGTGVGMAAGYWVTTGSKNTIIGGYDGNRGGLDIRTANNYIVLSDGDGNPRLHWNPAVGWKFASSSMAIGGNSDSSVFRTSSSGSGFHFSLPEVMPANNVGQPSDNTAPLGAGSYRWTALYAVSGTINTSDRNEKQDIQDLSAVELAVAQEIKTLFKSFRWKDAVAKKGDAARIHVGVIAQDVQAAFERQGLDASRYALFCSDTWYEIDGKAIGNDGTKYTAESEGAVAVTRLGVRYDQLLAFVIAAL